MTLEGMIAKEVRNHLANMDDHLGQMEEEIRNLSAGDNLIRNLLLDKLKEVRDDRVCAAEWVSAVLDNESYHRPF